jgi:hypothetical protein
MFGELFKNYKWPIIISLIILTGLIGYSVYLTISRAGKEPVKVYAVPSDATITANGQPIAPGTTYLAPGEYSIEATRGGFTSYKETIKIDKPNETDIDIALRGVSKSAIEWEQKNQKLYLEREGRAGIRAGNKGERFSKANPIVRKLPFKNLLLTIGYQLDPADKSEMSIILQIDAAAGYRAAALQKVRDLGFEPTDFKINFKNYVSPFSHE